MALETIRPNGTVKSEPMTTVFYVTRHAILDAGIPIRGRNLWPKHVADGPFFDVQAARGRAEELQSQNTGLGWVFDVAHVTVPEARKHTQLAQLSPYVLTDSKLRQWGQI